MLLSLVQAATLLHETRQLIRDDIHGRRFLLCLLAIRRNEVGDQHKVVRGLGCARQRLAKQLVVVDGRNAPRRNAAEASAMEDVVDATGEAWSLCGELNEGGRWRINCLRQKDGVICFKWVYLAFARALRTSYKC